MVANIRGYTPNYSFKLINFDTPRWHTLEYSNWNMVDAMFLQNGTPQMRGVWQNNTQYLEGDRVFDEETSAVYRCLIEHESAELGTFAEDRTLHPTYWSLQLSGTPVYRGEWLPGVTYVLGDIVYIDQYEYFLCTQGNVSSGDFPSDAAKWQTIFDATQVVADAEAAKAAAYQFSLDAQASATDALESENNAETAETDAEAWANDARAASGSFRWAFSTDTAAIDPAVGRLAFNTATPTTVTEIYLSAQSSEVGNPDVSAWVETWDDSTNPNTRGTVQIRKVGAPEQFLIFNLTGSIVDNGSWLRLPVAYVSHSGSLTNAEPLSVGFVRAGNVGPTGTGGGDMLKANNLSDVASIPTSRTNLGLGTTQIPTFSQVLLTSPPTVATHAATKSYVDASPSLYISDTQPGVNPAIQDGSLWWDSDRGTLLVYYNDGTSRQWVDAVAIPGIDTSGFVLKAGDTMTGDLAINKNHAALTLKQAALNPGEVFPHVDFAINDKLMWRVAGCWGDPTTAPPSGGHFSIDRYNDAGVYVASPLTLERNTGFVSVEYFSPAEPYHIAPKAYVDSKTPQRISLAGGKSFDISVPAGATTARVLFLIKPTTNVAMSPWIQVSVSPGVFITSADYVVTGFAHAGVASTMTPLSGAQIGMYTAGAHENRDTYYRVEGTIQLKKPTTAMVFTSQFDSSAYTVAGGFVRSLSHVYIQAVATGAALNILALRIMSTAGDVWDADSYLHVEWM